MATTLFEKLAQGHPQQAKKPTERRPKRADLVARWKQKTETEAFVRNLLADGPMSAAIIEELGAARKISKKQLWSAKQRIGAVAFKKKGKFDSGWLWSHPQIAPKQSSTAKLSHTRAIRSLAKSQGFRLRPISKATGSRP
jgi:hypothetical protein